MTLLAALTARLLEVDQPSRVRFAVDMIERSGLQGKDLESLLNNLGAAFSETLKRRGAEEPGQRFCSFCHRRQDAVRILVAATQAAICDECAEIVAETIAQRRDGEETSA